jgi:hypothetical protein
VFTTAIRASQLTAHEDAKVAAMLCPCQSKERRSKQRIEGLATRYGFWDSV